jgi:anti-sigma factor RsiW
MTMSPEHAELQRDIAEYARGDIDPLRRARLEAHLAGCAECEQLVVVASAIAPRPAVPADWNGDHPPPALLERAANEHAPHEPGVQGHLARCESCCLEVEILRRHPAQPTRAAELARPALWPPRFVLGLATGLAVGVVGAMLVATAIVAPRTHGPWNGEAPMLLIEDVSRGPETVARVERVPGQPFVPVGLRFPPGASGARYRIQILDRGGDEIWQTVLAEDRIESQRQRSWIATVLVPAEVLSAGRYSVRVEMLEPSGTSLLVDAAIEVER